MMASVSLVAFCNTVGSEAIPLCKGGPKGISIGVRGEGVVRLEDGVDPRLERRSDEDELDVDLGDFTHAAVDLVTILADTFLVLAVCSAEKLVKVRV